MSVIGTIKQIVGGGEPGNQYRCEECGASFEKHLPPDDHLLSCPECDSGEVELVEAGSI